MQVILLILFNAFLYDVPPKVALGVCMVESRCANVHNWNDNGSPSYGPMQIKFRTAKHYNKQLTKKKMLKAKESIPVAMQHLQILIKKYGIKCAVAAYNLGSCKKSKNGRIWNQEYVDKVFTAVSKLKMNLKKMVSEEQQTDILKLITLQEKEVQLEHLNKLIKGTK